MKDYQLNETIRILKSFGAHDLAKEVEASKDGFIAAIKKALQIDSSTEVRASALL